MALTAEEKKARSREYCARNRDRINERNAKWRAENRDWVKRYNGKYYERNGDTIRGRTAAWVAANPERHQKNKDARRTRNPEAIAAYFRDYYERNKEKCAAYWQQNKERFAPRNRETQHRRRAREKQATIVPFTEEQLAARLSMYGHRCWMCGGTGEHVDHVIALARGGPHALANLRPACARCNKRKSKKDWRSVQLFKITS